MSTDESPAMSANDPEVFTSPSRNIISTRRFAAGFLLGCVVIGLVPFVRSPHDLVFLLFFCVIGLMGSAIVWSLARSLEKARVSIGPDGVDIVWAGRRQVVPLDQAGRFVRLGRGEGRHTALITTSGQRVTTLGGELVCEEMNAALARARLHEDRH